MKKRGGGNASANALGRLRVQSMLHWSDRLFDQLQQFWVSARTKRATANLLIVIFVVTLIIIELNRQGLLPDTLAQRVPLSHFSAISLAFSFFLIIEIIGLIFALEGSVAISVGKQFELFSLILLREAFKEFSYFAEPIAWQQIEEPVLHMLADAGGALLIFVVIGFYYRVQLHRPITTDLVELSRFITSKKTISLLLLVAFLLIGLDDMWQYLTGGSPYPFFETFYTVLIFTDVLIVLISLRYTATYHVVFRNAGFALATVLLRIALIAPPYISALLGLGAVIFALGLATAYNIFGPTQEAISMEEEKAPTAPASAKEVGTSEVH